MAQDPAAGTAGFRFDRITITISQGPPLVEVPNVFGLSESQAKKSLADAGLVTEVKYEFFGRLPGARVVRQSPDSDKQAPKGSAVTITIG